MFILNPGHCVSLRTQGADTGPGGCGHQLLSPRAWGVSLCRTDHGFLAAAGLARRLRPGAERRPSEQAAGHARRRPLPGAPPPLTGLDAHHASEIIYCERDVDSRHTEKWVADLLIALVGNRNRLFKTCIWTQVNVGKRTAGPRVDPRATWASHQAPTSQHRALGVHGRSRGRCPGERRCALRWAQASRPGPLWSRVAAPGAGPCPGSGSEGAPWTCAR